MKTEKETCVFIPFGDDWKKEMEENFWVNGYVNAQAAKKRLDEEYAEYQAVLTEVGLAKAK